MAVAFLATTFLAGDFFTATFLATVSFLAALPGTIFENLDLSLAILFLWLRPFLTDLSKTEETLMKASLLGLAMKSLTIFFMLFLKATLALLFLRDFLNDFFADKLIGIVGYILA